MFHLYAAGVFALGSLASLPLGVGVWCSVIGYDGNMGMPIVILLQIPKVFFFGLLPFLLLSMVLRARRYHGKINWYRIAFYTGITWSFIWFAFFELGGPIAKGLEEDFLLPFMLIFLVILPILMSLGIVLSTRLAVRAFFPQSPAVSEE